MKPDIFSRINPAGDAPPTPARPSVGDRSAIFPSGRSSNPDEVRFVMCRPAYLSTDIPNNVFMEDQPPITPADRERAVRQFTHLTRYLREVGVTVLEIPPTEGAQDQTFTANIAVAVRESKTIVLANYKAPGRAIEEAPAREFFEQMGYRVIRPATKFEGEADFKRWKPGIFFGGHGKFTDRPTLDWISQQGHIQVIPLEETSDELYHLDCCLWVIDEEHFLVNRDGISPRSFRLLESLGEVIVVPTAYKDCGATNVVRVPGKKLVVSGMQFPEVPAYQKAMEWMEEICDRFGLSVKFTNIDVTDRSGADVSCQVMHLDFFP